MPVCSLLLVWTIPPARYEVIIVDDGSKSPPETEVASFNERGRRAMTLSMPLTISQVSNAVGFLFEWMNYHIKNG